MERKIEDLSDIELKAVAYDTLAAIQLHQNNLNAINGELARRAQANQGAQASQPPAPSGGIIPRLGQAEVV
jgi:hypothetical protein